MPLFLLLAFASAVMAFITEFVDEKKLLLTVAGWLILTLVFYLAHLLFGPATIGTARNRPSTNP